MVPKVKKSFENVSLKWTNSILYKNLTLAGILMSTANCGSSISEYDSMKMSFGATLKQFYNYFSPQKNVMFLQYKSLQLSRLMDSVLVTL